MPRVPLFVWLVVAGLAVCWIGLGSLMLPGARAGDFLNLYTGARLALEGNFADLHNVDVQLERERRILPGLPALLPFVRPPFYALLLAPLAMLPYGTAFICWITVQVLLLCGCMAWALKRFGPDALVFGMLYLPPPLGIASGQDCVEMLVLFILAYELTQRHKPLAAGAALAVMLFKFHLILLWPLALLVQRRWRMLGGFCAMAAGTEGGTGSEDGTRRAARMRRCLPEPARRRTVGRRGRTARERPARPVPSPPVGTPPVCRHAVDDAL